MKKNSKPYFVILTFFVLIFSCCQNKKFSSNSNSIFEPDFSKLSGPYLGQKPPGLKPEIFAPGIISNAYNEVCISFSKDAKEMFYSIAGKPHGVIFYLKEKNGIWTFPEVAPFSGNYSSEFLITPDGNRILLSTGAPLDEKGPPKSAWGLWVAHYENGVWCKASPLTSPLNSSEYSVVSPSLSTNGDLYFCSADYPGIIGGADILMSKQTNGVFEDIEVMNDSINTEYWEIDPFIASDGSFLIFSSNRPDGYGKFDLYISFRKKDGTWTLAKNMGNIINSKNQEVHPSISLDGKYLFFCSNRYQLPKYSEAQLSYKEKIEILNDPHNGNENIYWMDAEIIDKLKPKGIK